MAMDEREPQKPLQIWGRLSSINVRKVVWCAQELGLAFRRTDAGGPFGVVQTPQYRALNPNGLVPTIEIDDADAGARRAGAPADGPLTRLHCAACSSPRSSTCRAT